MPSCDIGLCLYAHHSDHGCVRIDELIRGHQDLQQSHMSALRGEEVAMDILVGAINDRHLFLCPRCCLKENNSLPVCLFLVTVFHCTHDHAVRHA